MRINHIQWPVMYKCALYAQIQVPSHIFSWYLRHRSGNGVAFRRYLDSEWFWNWHLRDRCDGQGWSSLTSWHLSSNVIWATDPSGPCGYLQPPSLSCPAKFPPHWLPPWFFFMDPRCPYGGSCTGSPPPAMLPVNPPAAPIRLGNQDSPPKICQIGIS